MTEVCRHARATCSSFASCRMFSANKDITVIGGSTAQVPPPYGYVKVDRDLNAGAGGDYVYFCTAKPGP